jgi:Transcriptional regulators
VTESQEPNHTVADVVRAAMPDLSSSELKVARALLAAYPSAGLDTAAGLASQAGVSAPTVVRFVARLGFKGYREFQRILREELQRERTASPLTLPARATAKDLREVSGRIFTDELVRTFTDLPEAELSRAVGLLADRKKRIWSFGGRFSEILATYLDLHLRQMRPDTRVLTEPPDRRAGFMLDVGRRDVCVVFDFRRYQPDVIELALHARSQGAQILLMTDPWLSPIAASADVVLPVRVESPSPFDSLVPATAAVETLVAGVLAELGGRAQDRMTLADSLAHPQPGTFDS